MKQPILVTSGAGTIGSHTSVDLLTAGHEVVVLDNLSNNSRRSVLQRIARIARIAFTKTSACRTARGRLL